MELIVLLHAFQKIRSLLEINPGLSLIHDETREIFSFSSLHVEIKIVLPFAGVYIRRKWPHEMQIGTVYRNGIFFYTLALMKRLKNMKVAVCE